MSGEQHRPGEHVVQGRYRLDVCLGVGMAEVWRAHDLRLDRPVAIKLLHTAEMADELALRFLREARHLAAVNSDRVVTVHDSGEIPSERGWQLFLVMQYVPGNTLQQTLDSGPIPAMEQILDWGKQLCEALADLHSSGLVHRDVKPGNVMVTPEGLLVLLDFGIARPLASQTSGLTRVGQLWGTPEYMAPELFLLDSPRPQSDLYALGCVLYEMITGRRLFPGARDWVELGRQHGSVPITAPGNLRPGVPRKLDVLVLELLEKNPWRRPAGAREAGQRLAGVLLPDPEPAKEDAARSGLEAEFRVIMDAEGSRLERAARLEVLVGRSLALLGTGHLTSWMLALHLAKALRQAGRITDAVSVLTQLEQILLDAQSPSNLLQVCQLNLAHCLGRSGRREEAVVRLRQLIFSENAAAGPGHPGTLEARHELAHWLAESVPTGGDL